MFSGILRADVCHYGFDRAGPCTQNDYINAHWGTAVHTNRFTSQKAPPRFGVALVGTVGDPRHVACLVAPLIEGSIDATARLIASSGVVAEGIAEDAARALAARLAELGLDVQVIDPQRAVRPTTAAPRSPTRPYERPDTEAHASSPTSPMHGLAGLGLLMKVHAESVARRSAEPAAVAPPAIEPVPMTLEGPGAGLPPPRVLHPAAAFAYAIPREGAPPFPSPALTPPPLRDAARASAIAAASRAREVDRPRQGARWPARLAVGLLALVGAGFYLTRSDLPDPERLLAQAEAALEAGDHGEALRLTTAARAADGSAAAVASIERRARIGPLLDAAAAHVEAGRLDQAQITLDAAAELAPGAPRLATLQLAVERARYAPGRGREAGAKVAVDDPIVGETPVGETPTVEPEGLSPEPAVEAAERPEPRVRAARLARLVLERPMGAAIVIDGRRTGQIVPATLTLTPGARVVELRNPFDGTRMARRKVRLAAGEVQAIAFDDVRSPTAPRPPESLVRTPIDHEATLR